MICLTAEKLAHQSVKFSSTPLDLNSSTHTHTQTCDISWIGSIGFFLRCKGFFNADNNLLHGRPLDWGTTLSSLTLRSEGISMLTNSSGSSSDRRSYLCDWRHQTAVTLGCVLLYMVDQLRRPCFKLITVYRTKQ